MPVVSKPVPVISKPVPVPKPVTAHKKPETPKKDNVIALVAKKEVQRAPAIVLENPPVKQKNNNALPTYDDPRFEDV